MITNPIGNPKVAILASLLMGGLTLTVFMLSQGRHDWLGDMSGFERRDAPPAVSPGVLRPGTLATGKVSVSPGSSSDASLVQVLDAVRLSLQRNDLASARILLSAEQTLYKDDSRIAALQNELQAREDAANRMAPAVERPVRTAVASRSGHAAWRSASRAEHVHGVMAPTHEGADSASQYAQSGHAPGNEAASNADMGNGATSNTANGVPASQAMAVSSLRPAQPVIEAPPVAQAAALPPPVTQPMQTTQSDAKPASVPSVASQAPKTRAEVSMEIERARADGALPRFGNPDPAGPGGAPSMVSHPVVLNW
jgi:hypothetical protein